MLPSISSGEAVFQDQVGGDDWSSSNTTTIASYI
jgi:hypothetical protein